MAENQFIEIDAPHLCVMENESNELKNDGIYGKALAEYLQTQLGKKGYNVPWFECEDWGWYVPAEIDGFRMEICVYGIPKIDGETSAKEMIKQEPARELNEEPAGTPLALCLQVGTLPQKYWDWKRFRRVDRSRLVANLNRELMEIFEQDSRITVVGRSDEFPLGS